MNMNRRDFLKVGAAIVPGVSAANAAVLSYAASGKQAPPTAGKGDMLYRRLGHTGVLVSALGVGGHHLGDFPSVDEAVRLVHEAIDAGVTFFDNCWEYYNGKTENILGRALKGRRDKVFLMTKVCTHGRSGRLALQMLEMSLRRLQTDHLDLWQIHGIVYDNDPELAYAKGGVLEALDQAKKEGKTRFVGFSGHKDPAFHLKMLELGYPFDTVQMPLNPFDASFHSFEKQVLPEVNRRGMAGLGMKSMGGTAWAIKKGIVKPGELLRYAMSLPVATTISGMDSLEVLHQNLRVVRGFQPMTESEMDALRARCAPTAADGRFEPYKVSLRYDNPMTRLPHGFPIDSTQREVAEMLEKGDAPWLPPRTMPPA
jgi:predicted aldo/keto reductase-like oxidoreductase